MLGLGFEIVGRPILLSLIIDETAMLRVPTIGLSAATKAARLCHRLIAERSGASAVMVGLVISGLLGFVGLGTEAAHWYVSQRTMQGAADAAAYGAALAGSSSTMYTVDAQAIAASYGFVNQQAGVTVTVNNPPASGNYTGDSSAVEMIISQPQQRLFSTFYLAVDPTLGGRAVVLRGAGSECVVALNQNASGAISGGGQQRSTWSNVVSATIPAAVARCR